MSPNRFTRFYRPPEVIVGKDNYSESVDVWSIGCLTSELIQKTRLQSDDIEILFMGDSCYPYSQFDNLPKNTLFT